MAIWTRKRRGRKLTTPDNLPAVTLPANWPSSLDLYGLRGSYGYLYRTQPNVRSVVDYYATQVASVKLKMYRRMPVTALLPDGRLEQPAHDLQRLLNRPAPGVTTRSRLWFETAADTLVYDVAHWRKVRDGAGRVFATVRVPPTALVPQFHPVTNRLTHYTTTTAGQRVELDELVTFPGYDPEAYDGRISPLETLRRILAEEQAAGANRQGLWRNAARKDGVVERPADAPEWDDEMREAWRHDFEAVMSGATNSGRVGLLEDGMTWKETSWNPQEMEYLGGRKLTRQECASAFRIDPRLVFATDEPASDEARNGFNVDRLVPGLIRMAEEVDLQLLPDFEPVDDAFYTEFNVDAKLRGSLIQEAQFLSMATGRAWLLTNEARKRHNLPPVPEGEGLVTPLNVLVGGQASPRSPLDTPGPGVAPGETPGPKTYIVSMTESELDRVRSALAALGADGKDTSGRDAGHAERVKRLRTALTRVAERHLERQGRTVLNALGAVRKTGGDPSIDTIWLDGERWDRELERDLRGAATAEGVGEDTLRLGMLGAIAKLVNEYTRARVGEELAADDVSAAFRSSAELARVMDRTAERL